MNSFTRTFTFWFVAIAAIWGLANLPRRDGAPKSFVQSAGFPWTFADWVDGRLESFNAVALLLDVMVGLLVASALGLACAYGRGEWLSRSTVSKSNAVTPAGQGLNRIATYKLGADAVVQLFNEAVLGSAATDAIPVLLTSTDANWSPRQVVLDYKAGKCYGAMVHYDRLQSFEILRSAINKRFSKHEQTSFAENPTMGIWRVEDAGFTIQLSDDNNENTYLAIYVLFVDPALLASKLAELSTTQPELFDDFPLDEFTENLRKRDTTNPPPPEAD